MTKPVEPRVPINWLGAIVLTTTPAVAAIAIPWYAIHHHLGTAAWVSFFALWFANGLSITAGYHRLWAHRAYEAHWSVRIPFMLFGAMTVQNSILIWASSHRTHHRHIDSVEKDPYAAPKGFWFSHIGWMLRKYPAGEPNFSNANDLLNDRIVMFQHKYYLPLTLGMNGGLLRLVVSHHTTFFINSLAHMWGRQPYTDENSARDNDLLALFTHGEGYHNYHHIFQYDYRNGIRWWQYDPTKWLIAGLSAVGLTYNLKRCSTFAIEKARLTMQFKRAQQHLDKQPIGARVEGLKLRMAQEYDAFLLSMNEWGKLKEQWYGEKKQELMQKWEEASFRTRFKEIEYRLKMQRKRLQLLAAQAAMA